MGSSKAVPARPAMQVRKHRIRKSPGEHLFDGMNYLFMIVMAFVTLYPFWYILILSLNDGFDAQLGGIWFWPRKFSLSNYTLIFTITTL